MLRYIFAFERDRTRVLTMKDVHDNFEQSITRSESFQFSILDIWRMRSEMYIFCDRLKGLHKDRNPSRSIQSALNVSARDVSARADGQSPSNADHIAKPK